MSRIIIALIAVLFGAILGATLMSFAAADNTMGVYCDYYSVKNDGEVANWESQGGPCRLTSDAWKIFGLFFFIGFAVVFTALRVFIALLDFLTSPRKRPESNKLKD